MAQAHNGILSTQSSCVDRSAGNKRRFHEMNNVQSNFAPLLAAGIVLPRSSTAGVSAVFIPQPIDETQSGRISGNFANFDPMNVQRNSSVVLSTMILHPRSTVSSAVDVSPGRRLSPPNEAFPSFERHVGRRLEICHQVLSNEVAVMTRYLSFYSPEMRSELINVLLHSDVVCEDENDVLRWHESADRRRRAMTSHWTENQLLELQYLCIGLGLRIEDILTNCI